LKQLFTISKDNFTAVDQPVLAIRVGEYYCSYAIIESATGQLTQMAHYGEDEISADKLDEIFSSTDDMDRSFSDVLVCYDYPQQTMVPSQVYKAEDAPILLQTMCGNTSDASIVSELVPGWQMYNIYAVPKDIYEWMNRKFPSGKYWHHHSVAIKTVARSDDSGCISIDLGTDNFSLVTGKSNTFLLAQNFSYSTPADVVYYLLKVCKQFELKQRDVKLVLSGLIEKDSALYKILHQYFLNLEFRNALWNMDSSEYPAHFFTSLNDLALCAS